LGEKKPLLWLYSKQLQLEPEALKVIVLKLQELDIIQITLSAQAVAVTTLFCIPRI
jgi:hypothetical protein